MTIDNELIDNLLKDYQKPEDIIGENGLLKQLTKQLLERAMAAELTEHVGYEKHDVAGHKSGNSRNGKSAKTLKGSFGTMPIAVPRDRNGTLSRRSSRNIKRASPASMRTLFHCTRAAYQRARSNSIWKRFTTWKFRRR
jgi:transposase-like protein